ncbi:MAG: hypothetical protein ACOYB8_07600 [Eubacteriaceae bacterium]
MDTQFEISFCKVRIKGDGKVLQVGYGEMLKVKFKYKDIEVFGESVMNKIGQIQLPEKNKNSLPFRNVNKKGK